MPLFGASHTATTESFRTDPRYKYNSTKLRYDSTLVHDEEDQPLPSVGFRSSKTRRYNFKDTTQRLEDIQDDLDRANNEERTRIVPAQNVSRCKSLPGLRELVSNLQSFEKLEQTDVPSPSPLPRSKDRKSKKRVRSNLYEDEESDQPELQELHLKLKKVESKIKLQRHLLQSKQVHPDIDPLFTGFIRTTIQTRTPIPNQIQGYVSKYTLSDNFDAPLSQHAASLLLKSRFTTPDSSSSSSPSSSSSTTQLLKTGTRTIIKVQVNPLLLKRLGI